MKIFITGSNGFVGVNLLGFLKSKTNLDLHKIDRENLINPEKNDFDTAYAIVHLAGKAHDLKKISNPDDYYKVNFELTKKLFDHFLKSKAKKFVFISSVKSVADVVNGVLTEEVYPNPITDYGKSKLLAEQYIQKQALPVDKFVYILRPCMIHGPGNKGNLNLLYKIVQNGIPYPLAAFENKRSFLSVENLCFVIHNLLKKDIHSGIYNVSDDTSLSTNEVIQILSGSLGKKPKLWAMPKLLVRSLAKVGDILKLPLNTERLQKLTESYVISNQKITKALGVSMPVTARDGLLLTAKSFET